MSPFASVINAFFPSSVTFRLQRITLALSVAVDKMGSVLRFTHTQLHFEQAVRKAATMCLLPTAS